jgi:hypothetical protein
MMIVTELHEARQAALFVSSTEPFEVELADAAIRLLDYMHGCPNWVVRSGQPVSSRFCSPEHLLWQIIEPLCWAVEAWRDDRHTDSQVSLELAFAAIRGIAEGLDIDLFQVCQDKVEVNKTRGQRHGRKRSEG